MAGKVFGHIARLAGLAAVALAAGGAPALAEGDGPLAPAKGQRVALSGGFLLGPYRMDGAGRRQLVDDRGAPLAALSDHCFLTSVDDQGGRWVKDEATARVLWEDPGAAVSPDPENGGRWTMAVRGHEANSASAYCITQTAYPGASDGASRSASAPILMPTGRAGAILVGRDTRDIQAGDSFLIDFHGASPDLWALLEGDTEWSCAPTITEVDWSSAGIVEEGASGGATNGEPPQDLAARFDMPNLTVSIVNLEHADPGAFGVRGALSVATSGHRNQIIRGISFTCAIAARR